MNHKILWVLKASIGWRCPSFWPNHPICLAVKNRWAQLQKVGALNIHHPILGALNIQSTFLEPIFWELFEYPSSKKVAFVKKAASREQHQQQQLSSGWRYGGNHHGINLKAKAQISHWCSSICCHCEIIDIIYIYIYTEYIIYIFIIHSYYIYTGQRAYSLGKKTACCLEDSTANKKSLQQAVASHKSTVLG